jgi:hypothetical protein
VDSNETPTRTRSGTEPSGIVKASERLIMIVGNFGSGKTEVSVNLAIGLARAGRSVQIADLDLVNPYFRCREAQRQMEQHGIRVVVPPGAQAFADLPIVVPEIQGMLQPPEGTLCLFDVGGDDIGAKVLASLRPRIADGSYELWQVINSRRPFTDTVDGCLAMQTALEKASRLAVTGLLANSHLIEETTAETVLEGWRLARDVSRRNGLPVRGVAVIDSLADSAELDRIDAPLLRLERLMLPPWLLRSGDDDATKADSDTLPAARPVPLGKPGPVKLGDPNGDKDG